MTSPRSCSVCGKECAEHERNTDGTYLHDRCAIRTAMQPSPKEAK